MKATRNSTLHLLMLVLLVVGMLPAISGPTGVARAQDESAASPTAEVTVGLPTPEPVVTEEPTQTPTPTDFPTFSPTDLPTAEPTLPAPSPTPTETIVSTSSPSATSLATQSATSTPRATATETSTRNPSAGTISAGAVVTYTLIINSVDQNGNHISFTCFDIYHDAGSGAPGTRVTFNLCDDQSDGIIETKLAAGSYVLVETRRMSDVGRASNKSVTITANKSVTIKHQPLTTIVITSKDNVTNLPVAGACYNLEPLTPIIFPPSYFTCDSTDGTNDGITIIKGVDRGTFKLKEWSPPTGYLPVSDRDVIVSTLSSARAVTVGHDKGATILIHKQNSDNQAIVGACFQLLIKNGNLPGDQSGYTFCDSDDGGNDGSITGQSFQTGSFFLREFSAPAGYLPVTDQVISVTAGQTTELTLTDPTAGTVELHAVDDQANPIKDLCPAIFRDAGGGTRGDLLTLPPCDPGVSGDDGITKITGLTTGNYLIVQGGNRWSGYLPSADIPFSITSGETKTVQIVNAVGGTIEVTAVDAVHPATNVMNACFSLYVDAGGGTRGTGVSYTCDNSDGSIDGKTTISGLATGSYILDQAVAPVPFNPGPDQTFTIAIRETKSVTIQDTPYGEIRINKKTPGGAALKGACFIAAWGQDTETPGRWVGSTVCDDADGSNDGTIQIALPDGTFDLQETKVPAGYVRADTTSVEIAASATVDITIVDPTQSTLVLNYVDVWHDPVLDICVQLHGTGGPVGIGGACDKDDGTVDGSVTVGGLSKGTWTAQIDRMPETFHDPATEVILLPSASKTIEVVMAQDAPRITLGPFVGTVTQTSITIYWETDQKMIGSLAWGLTGALGQTAPSTPGAGTKNHRITISGLTPDTEYSFQALATSPNGDLSDELSTQRTLTTAANGKVIVSKVRTDSTVLPGSCFDIYLDAGGEELGDYVGGNCDKFEADGDNGKITFYGLIPGSYVLSEFYAPPGYKVAKSVPFTLTAGQTKRITVKDSRGGATVQVSSGVWGEGSLFGSCFAIFTDPGTGDVGDYVASMCDSYDGEDSITTLSGVGTGKYYLWEYALPTGYIRDPIQKFEIVRGQKAIGLTYYNTKARDNGNIAITAKTSGGVLVPGACFDLYTSDGSVYLDSYLRSQCDGDDGYEDGRTYFTGVQTGIYAVVEYAAPGGYVAGKKVSITKSAGKLASKGITQVEGGQAVKVTTLKGSTSTKLPGACYSLFRWYKNHWEFVTWACDTWDGVNDGITRIVGVPSGSYALFQSSTPTGYRRPTFSTIDVGSSTKSVTVRTSSN